MEVKIVKKINNSYFKNKPIVGLIGRDTDLFSLVNDVENITLNIKKSVKSELKKHTKLCSDFALDNRILNKKIIDLSQYELKIISLIKALSLNPEMIILNNFEVGMNDLNRKIIIRKIRNLMMNSNIKFIIISESPLFLNKLTKKIIVMKNGIIKFQGDIISAIKQKLILMPPILEFIEMAKAKKKELDYTLDERELLKDIYRRIT